MYGGDENDCCALKTEMLADHGRELKAIELRHADIHQHHGYLGFEKNFESFFRRVGFDQIFAETAEHDLIAQQLAWLIVDHENIYSFVRTHSFPRRSGLNCLVTILPVQPHTQR